MAWDDALSAVLGAALVVNVLLLLRAAAGAFWHRWHALPDLPGLAGEDEEPGTVLRRCESCRVGWKASPGEELSTWALRKDRFARRRRRTPGQRLPRSWSRCPHCLSRQVRTSSRSRSAHTY